MKMQVQLNPSASDYLFKKKIPITRKAPPGLLYTKLFTSLTRPNHHSDLSHSETIRVRRHHHNTNTPLSSQPVTKTAKEKKKWDSRDRRFRSKLHVIGGPSHVTVFARSERARKLGRVCASVVPPPYVLPCRTWRQNFGQGGKGYF